MGLRRSGGVRADSRRRVVVALEVCCAAPVVRIRCRLSRDRSCGHGVCSGGTATVGGSWYKSKSKI